MVRPRWHDAVIVVAITGVLVLGVWALWWDDVRAYMNWGPSPGQEEPAGTTPVPRGQT